MRTFISFPISNSVKTKIKNYQEKIKANNKNIDIKWTQPEKMHVTLKFIGDINREEVNQLTEILKKSSQHINNSLKYNFYKVDAFPNLNHPSVIITKLKEEGRRGFDLEQNLRSYLKKYKFPFDEKKWIPHITIGRVKDDRIDLYLPKPNFDFGWEVEKIHIKKSELTSSGPNYETLATIRF